jgi:hypothetical protein
MNRGSRASNFIGLRIFIASYPRERCLTPGITRREALTEAFKLTDDIHALSGRVHAVVRTRLLLPLALRHPTQLCGMFDHTTSRLTFTTSQAALLETRPPATGE